MYVRYVFAALAAVALLGGCTDKGAQSGPLTDTRIVVHDAKDPPGKRLFRMEKPKDAYGEDDEKEFIRQMMLESAEGLATSDGTCTGDVELLSFGYDPAGERHWMEGRCTP